MTDETDQTEDRPQRFAVYDETLQQYVGGTHATQTAAKDAASELRKQRRHKGHKLDVRAV